MHCDRIRSKLDLLKCSHEVTEILERMGDRVIKLNAYTGVIHWESGCWNSLRSDFGGVSFRVSDGYLLVDGSPAHCLGTRDPVFGSSHCHSSSFSLPLSLQAQIDFLSHSIGLDLPSFQSWTISLIDLTGNYYVSNVGDVDILLDCVRGIEGGRYSSHGYKGGSVYINSSSRVRSLKCYPKGRHLRWAQKQKEYDGVTFSEEDLSLADHLFRFEFSLKNRWFSQQSDKWYNLNNSVFFDEYDAFFSRFFSSFSFSYSSDKKSNDDSSDDFTKSIYSHASSPQCARAAILFLSVIRDLGFEGARLSYSKATFYRHLRLLRDSGFSDLDLSHGQKINDIRPGIKIFPVSTWEELRNFQ